MDLALILTLLTALTGAVVALDRFVLRTRRAANPEATWPGVDTAVEYSRSFFPVLLFVLVIRSFVFEPFRIPSGSMMPTLLQGDYIFVKKYAYGLRLPVTETEILETGRPERGDVVVFRLPEDPNVNYIKRVVGLPGDRLEYVDHRIMINGTPVPLAAEPESAQPGVMPRFRETLGEREHAILISDPDNSMRDGVYEVPEGHYFMLGDNRDNSRDSRYLGTIPESHLVGEAVRVWMHMDGIEWPDWSRIGTRIE